MAQFKLCLGKYYYEFFCWGHHKFRSHIISSSRMLTILFRPTLCDLPDVTKIEEQNEIEKKNLWKADGAVKRLIFLSQLNYDWQFLGRKKEFSRCIKNILPSGWNVFKIMRVGWQPLIYIHTSLKIHRKDTLNSLSICGSFAKR